MSFSKKLGLEKFAKTSLFQTKETLLESGLQDIFNVPYFSLLDHNTYWSNNFFDLQSPPALYF